ncbi:hypothetical protein A4A49_21169 [Nicotiana attenuata]|uniref:Uncharacterized protein n=1 Tax=Nicotiana attenuata TaxID=49451 RepID=A0A1J6HWJ0_NICAT|nr:hypothetical protein A4A49_21169 [Nicotiana attenuata]
MQRNPEMEVLSLIFTNSLRAAVGLLKRDNHRQSREGQAPLKEIPYSLLPHSRHFWAKGISLDGGSYSEFQLLIKNWISNLQALKLSTKRRG